MYNELHALPPELQYYLGKGEHAIDNITRNDDVTASFILEGIRDVMAQDLRHPEQGYLDSTDGMPKTPDRLALSGDDSWKLHWRASWKHRSKVESIGFCSSLNTMFARWKTESEKSTNGPKVNLATEALRKEGLKMPPL